MSTYESHDTKGNDMIDNPLNRLYVKRGSQLPHAKLHESDVVEILHLVEHREQLRRQLRQLTNASIAARYGVHMRTIDRITAGEAWTHVEIDQ